MKIEMLLKRTRGIKINIELLRVKVEEFFHNYIESEKVDTYIWLHNDEYQKSLEKYQDKLDKVCNEAVGISDVTYMTKDELVSAVLDKASEIPLEILLDGQTLAKRIDIILDEMDDAAFGMVIDFIIDHN